MEVSRGEIALGGSKSKGGLKKVSFIGSFYGPAAQIMTNGYGNVRRLSPCRVYIALFWAYTTVWIRVSESGSSPDLGGEVRIIRSSEKDTAGRIMSGVLWRTIYSAPVLLSVVRQDHLSVSPAPSWVPRTQTRLTMMLTTF